MDDSLLTLLEGRPIGAVSRDRQGRLRFTYEESWRQDPASYPLSLSMPLALAEHPHDRIEAFLWGLLPDNELVLERWAKQHHVSARNPFALLSHVGEDCAGAVQFVTRERLQQLDTQAAPEVTWLSEADVAARLRALRSNHAAWRAEHDSGQFSLAGAQPKTALLHCDGRWGIPSGRTPTTHILKPPIGTFDGHAENEHFCLALARALGLVAASSKVATFEDEVAIVVERYDRIAETHSEPGAPSLRRVHQEDMCQALGVHPTRKYQNEGGPDAGAIVNLLRDHSIVPQEDVRTFVDALVFNWLIAGTDAHAKNYSLLHGAGGRVRLAPLYDLASALPYPSLDQRRLKLAMKLGDTYSMRNASGRHLRALATSLRLKPDAEVERAHALATQVLEKVENVREQTRRGGLRHALLDHLTTLLSQRAAQCRDALRLR